MNDSDGEQPDSPASKKHAARWVAAYAGVIVVALVLVASTLRVFAPVVDEPAHIAAGYEWWHGHPSFEPSHPPLARVIEAWPLRKFVTGPPTALGGHRRTVLSSNGGRMSLK